MLACIPSFLTLGSFRHKVHLYMSNKSLKALTYQSLDKAEEGLTRDAETIIETIRSCDRDDRLNTQKIIAIGIQVAQV
jgi:hypothetical protein